MNFNFYNTPWSEIGVEKWQYFAFKKIFEFRKEKPTVTNPTVLSLTQNGIKIRDISTNEGQLAADYSDSSLVLEGDFVLNPMDLRSGSVSISEYEGVTSNAYYIFKIRDEMQSLVNPKFLESYLLANYKNDGFYSHGNGIGRPEGSGGRWTLGRETLEGYPVPVPSIEDQNRIVANLEKSINSIDSTIIMKLNQNTLFFEWIESERNRLIAGVDQIDKVKTSIPWMPMVKKDWVYTPLRSVLSWRKGKDSARLNAEYCSKHEGIYPGYSGQTENEGVVGSISAYDFDVPEGCLLLSTVGAQAGRLRLIHGKFSLSQNCAIIIRKNDTVEYSYIFYVWNSLWNIMKSEIPTDMQPSVRFSDLAQQKIYLPSVTEQLQIIALIEDKESLLLSRIENNNLSIKMMRDLRDSLVLSTVARDFCRNLDWSVA